MKFYADFHIHSHYSLATSKQLTPEHLDYWCRVKGMNVVATGDFTHPGWIAELKDKLGPAEDGLFRLKKEIQLPEAAQLPGAASTVRFLLSAEISSIYKKNDRVRKVHNLLFVPDFASAERLNRRLSEIGNLKSDGRPILGLDSKRLLEIFLEECPDGFLAPAHVWTPWFSLLGEKSGFDRLTDCYEDLSQHIFAAETGLSSDAPMNWLVSTLDQCTLLANSDAHSPDRIGRNANILHTELSFFSIKQAMQSGGQVETVHLFPQEGKYHFDGHRKCGICWDPLTTLKNRCLCPVCGKKVVVGVMHRVAVLADRSDISTRPKCAPFHSIIPLRELLSEIIGSGESSKKVLKVYFELIQKAGNELFMLLEQPLEDLGKLSPELSEAVRRMRAREVFISEGYDGEYGTVKAFRPGEAKSFGRNSGFFQGQVKLSPRPLVCFDVAEFQRLGNYSGEELQSPVIEAGANPQQEEAIRHFQGPALILAGPGTGKTRTIVERIRTIAEHVNPSEILAVTFTNRSAAELKSRLSDLGTAGTVKATTFHGLGLSILSENLEQTGRKPGFSLISESDRNFICSLFTQKTSVYSKAVSARKQLLKYDEPEGFMEFFVRYEEYLSENNLFDLDDLLCLPVQILETNQELLEKYRTRFSQILVDEYQDVNPVQYKLLRLLAPGNANLCAVGDPDQAIYGFRGADVGFIRRFQEDYPLAKTFNLVRSYRCSNTILKASSGIVHSAGGFLQGLEKGVRLNLSSHPTDKSEAEFIARNIERMAGGLRFFSLDSSVASGESVSGIESLADFAVLVRTRTQMKALEKAFHDHSIPYQSVDDEDFFGTDPVAATLDLLRLSLDPGNGFLREKLKGRADLPETGLKLSDNQTVKNALLLCTKYQKDVNASEIGKLLDYAERFGSDFDGFLKQAFLCGGTDLFEEKVERVSLLTIHAAKGLEFTAVFIAGCEDGLLPYHLYETMKSDLDEETRLFYVAMTRAKKYLFLSSAEHRFLHGREFRLPRSRFLSSIEQELLEVEKPRERPAEQLGMF
ncbi:MAG: UvrD-helicase domain-containing protein [Candidatus Wallbacteria bacterium]|nr:UvrD-helicase domain-containing protein [Candidatus Wallbacteria bacterium]